ncbi:hypothetical protein M413DRAFT_30263 [Hebeloma cylindrosporum]|uniref:WSC domain-containing protein n=1 Tax=Hebeloma cylindrosporum TaxID=76867 RepID=A0A0C3BP48_HEBCY|nr:hypothetical protein M413DRAFT_30263 [Hebeloma cylindrosporum h7]
MPLFDSKTTVFFLGSLWLAAKASPSSLETRQSLPALPAGWESIGCFTDSPANRTLRTAAFTDVNNMTIESCIAFCTPGGYQYAGVEFSRECYCDNLIESSGVPAIDGGCNMTCTGNSAEICGGAARISVFSLTTPPAPPAGWASVGCYTDVSSNRTLRTAAFTDVNDMTIESCTAFCTPAGYQYAGVEFGRECYCDNVIEAPGGPAPDGTAGCNMPCTGNAAETCGGAGRINIFNSTVGKAPASSIKQTVGSYQYRGCFQDAVNGGPRSLLNRLDVPGGVSAETCTAACKAAGFPLAGLEFGQECWCDTYMPLVIPAPDSDCNTPCQADATELCGSGNRLAVYQGTSVSPPNFLACLSNQRLVSNNAGFRFHMQALPLGGSAGPITNPTLIGTLELVAQAGAPSFFLLSTNGTATENVKYTFTGSELIPDSFDGEGNPVALPPVVGSAQVFSLFGPSPSPVPYNGYCAMPNPSGSFGPFIGPPALAVNRHADEWAVCRNHTSGRFDVVFSPLPSTRDYNISDCQNVVLQMSQLLAV